MTNATTGLLDRYQEYRVRRWLVQEERTAGMLPGWRTQRRRRMLVVVVTATLIVLAVAGLLCAFGLTWAALLTLPAAVVFMISWVMLRIASNRQDHAPEEVLDELEIAERNKAHSAGLSLTQMLTLPPLMFLIFSGAIVPEADAFRTAYAGGVMMLAALLAGGCAPAMILGWNRPDPEPEG
ncbi:hypothetical protein [Nocardia cyriacigeorgica]|uniref:Uncharacterized protein n=1 Tax=Nocardia cyriacigeorgica TaxID=135487 RepID=A0A5R8P0Y6_9NOCA|nr:hypothetical protein [Nocardia cyriacigeorgica]TLF82558.1 hypothetical protein FEK34_02130 [Nocardia cyriacigeorgica]